MAGGGKEITVQLNGVTTHPDGSIQNAKVCFLVSLQPGAVAHLKPQPCRSTVSTGLNISRVGDAVELKDGLVGARFRLVDKRFETPIRAHEAPSLLEAVQLRGGAWTGRDWFGTPKQCRSYKVPLPESGPVFARIAFDYRFDGFRGEGGDIYRGTA